MNNRIDWDSYFMILAKAAALRSTCLARPVGCVIVRDNQVLSTGYNGSPFGYRNCIDYNCNVVNHKDQSSKYDYCFASHAESNAVSIAAKNGIPLDNSVVYCTLAPCITCAKTMIMAGIKEVIYELEYTSTDKNRDLFWSEFMNTGLKTRKLIMPKIDFEVNKITSERKRL